MRKVSVFAVAIMFMAGGVAYAQHHGDQNHEQDTYSNPASKDHHDYTIHENDPRADCWNVHTDGGPKGSKLIICKDK